MNSNGEANIPIFEGSAASRIERAVPEISDIFG